MNEQELKRMMYPRVTEIIGLQNERNMRNIPIENLVKAGERGSKVHEYCTIVSKGLLLPGVEEECQPYVDAWINWSSLNVGQVIATGERLYDDELKFSGEYDLICKLVGSEKIALIDWKATSVPSITWPIQLAAYKRLCLINGINLSELHVVHFKKSHGGSVKIQDIGYPDLTTSWDIFESALKCYKYFTPKKEKAND